MRKRLRKPRRKRNLNRAAETLHGKLLDAVLKQEGISQGSFKKLLGSPGPHHLAVSAFHNFQFKRGHPPKDETYTKIISAIRTLSGNPNISEKLLRPTWGRN